MRQSKMDNPDRRSPSTERRQTEQCNTEN